MKEPASRRNWLGRGLLPSRENCVVTTTLYVYSLHALAWCESIFYLEQVENLRFADERVYAGRRPALDFQLV